MPKKLFIALCIAAPVSFAMVRAIFPQSVSVAAVFAITGLVLSVVLLGWSIWNLFHHRRRAMLGFGSVLVCFCFLVVIADYFAAHEQRQRQSSGTNATEFTK
jgi:uncharacterized membrane protein